jgi:hypothetical protein
MVSAEAKARNPSFFVFFIYLALSLFIATDNHVRGRMWQNLGSHFFTSNLTV